VEETSCVRPDVRRFLETQADAGRSDLDAAELVVGELVANAVRHGAPPFGVCIDWHDDPPMLCVVDRGRGMRPVYPAPDPESERGRGLLLVRALAGELVVDSSSPDRDGTRVVVALPVHRRTPAPRAA
jgi:serine/threonine-protein kinase RsbW